MRVFGNFGQSFEGHFGGSKFVSGSREADLCDFEIFVVNYNAIWLLWSTRDDENSKYANWDSDNTANNVHPPPASKAMHAVKPRRCSGLDQGGGECPESEADVKNATAASNLVTSIPRPWLCESKLSRMAN